MIKQLGEILKHHASRTDEIHNNYEIKKQYIGQSFKGEDYQCLLSLAKAEREQELNALEESTKQAIVQVVDNLRAIVDNQGARA